MEKADARTLYKNEFNGPRLKAATFKTDKKRTKFTLSTIGETQGTLGSLVALGFQASKSRSVLRKIVFGTIMKQAFNHEQLETSESYV